MVHLQSWEYPGVQGIGCNVISPQDTSNFLLFLQELRTDPIGSNLTLSAATAITPFADTKGNPSADVSQFSEVLDYIVIMNYDIWGPWSDTVGPNAPLDDSCAPSYAQIGSATSSIKAWTAAGMPANQIVLGVPSYGYAFSVTPENAFIPGSDSVLADYPPFNKTNQPSGDKWDGQPGVDECGNHVGAGGIWNYDSLVDHGFVDGAGNVTPGNVGRFDNCSQTVGTLLFHNLTFF
jgi:chitinase